jgi:hypothetical protein
MKYSALLTLGISAILIFHAGCGNPSTKSKTMGTDALNDFGKRYATAWCSQKPDSVAGFFAENGSLTVNKGEPAIGRVAIAKSAEGFMTAFPDLRVVMDSLVTTSRGTEFHWTLFGTNTGPGGTGKKVQISGVEIWQMGSDGLVLKSMGSFDAEEYNRQINVGVKD